MARLFRSRRKGAGAGPADDTAPEPAAEAPESGSVVTTGVAPVIAEEWVADGHHDGQHQGERTAGTQTAARPDGTELHERSDPSVAATEGLWEVIRPAAIVPEHAARRVLIELARRDLGNGGEWQSEPQLWSRFDRASTDEYGRPNGEVPELMGTVHVTYGTPTKYEITLYRVSVTASGVEAGWTVASLTDEALGFGGLSLADCPRATVNEPPRPFRY